MTAKGKKIRETSTDILEVPCLTIWVTDVIPILGLLHHTYVGDVADVSGVHAAAILMSILKMETGCTFRNFGNMAYTHMA
jgi:hypothetical protein